MDMAGNTPLKALSLIFDVLVFMVGIPCLRAENAGHIYLTDGGTNSVDVIRASDHVRLASIPTAFSPYGLAITRNGRRLFVTSWDHMTISEYDTETNTLISNLKLGSELREAALTPDERYLYVPDYNESVVHIISTMDLTVVTDVAVDLNPHMVAFGAFGRYAYVTNEAGQTLSVIDTRTRTVVNRIPMGETPIGVAASPDTETIYVANFSANQVSFVSVTSQSVEATVSLPSAPYAVTVSPTGEYLYVVAGYPSSGYVISVASRSIIGTFPVGDQPRNIVATPDGDTLYETNFGSSDMYAIDARTLQLKFVRTVDGPNDVLFTATSQPMIESYQFQSVDYPGASQTMVAQTNDAGTAVGWYVDPSGVNHGFFHRHGHFTPYDVPGSSGTRLLGINSEGVSVGLYTNAQGYINGFRLRNEIRSDVFVQFESGGITYSVPTNEVDGIDDHGNLAGVYWNPVQTANYAFEMDGSALSSFDYPGAVYTSANGIAEGTVSGWFADSSSLAHAFFWHNGEFTQFDFPGAGPAPDSSIGYTLGYKINSRQDSVGLWNTAFSPTHGYLHQDRTQKNISFDFPEAVSTSNYGISECGRISGSYLLNNVTHGFVAVPEECK